MGEDGTVGSIVTTTNRYDDRGNLVQIVTHWDLDANGTVDQVYMDARTYDKQGNPLLTVAETDFDANGTADELTTITYTNLNHNQTSEFISVDRGADGTVDLTATRTRTFDNRGNLVQQVTEYDSNGIVDHRSVETWTYDYRNNQMIYLSGATKTTYVLNHRGDRISSIREWDLDGDGVAETTQTTTYSFDKFGNLVRWRSEFLMPTPDGVIKSMITATNFYLRRAEVVGPAK